MALEVEDEIEKARQFIEHTVENEDSFLKQYFAYLDQEYGKYRIGVITALTKELAAVKLALGDSFDLFHTLSNAPYYGFRIKAKPPQSGEHWIVVCKAPKMGNSASAIAATALQKDFRRLANIIMVGIAGAVPDLEDPSKDVHLGDIVISSGKGLVQYDMTKIEHECIVELSAMPPPSAELSKIVEFLEAERLAHGHCPWDEYIDIASAAENGRRPNATKDPLHDQRKEKMQDTSRRQERPKVHYGIIGSANALVKDADLRDELKQRYDVLAVEMEGSGIGDASWFFSAGYLVIRGTCDYCDKGKSDVWQAYAAACAAGYLRALVERVPLPSI